MKVKIENFQSIEKAELEVKGFTALIGKNNIGKSAVTRAIRSVVRNRGDFTRDGKNQSVVTLIDSDFTITRKKGTTVNDYEINGKEFKKVGKDVPQEVVDLGFKPVQVGDEKVFIQFPNQFEKIFLLDKPDSVVAEAISKVTRIDAVNSALHLVSKDQKRSESTLKVRRSDLEVAQEKITVFKRINELNAITQIIQAIQSEIDRQEKILEEVSIYILRLEQLNARISLISQVLSINIPEISNVFDLFKSLTEIEILYSRFTSSENRLACLRSISQISFSNLPSDQVKEYTFIRDSLQQIDFFKNRILYLRGIKDVILPDIQKIAFLAVDQVALLESFENSFNVCSKQVQDLQQQHLCVTQDLDALLEEVKSLKQGSICPFQDIFECKKNW